MGEGKPTLEDLRRVVLTLSDDQLASIGISVSRDDGQWQSLQQAMVDALHAEGRWRAAKGLAETDLRRGGYSMQISMRFLIHLNAILTTQGTARD